METEDIRTDTDKVEATIPRQKPKAIAKHRRRRSSQEYLIHDVGKDPGTGTWIKHKEVPPSVLNDYLSQQNYPSTRAKAQVVPTINMITLPSKDKETSFPLFRMIVILSLIASILPCLTLRTTGLNRDPVSLKPDVGTLSSCGITRFDGVYALPDNMRCIDNKNLANIQHILKHSIRKGHHIDPG